MRQQLIDLAGRLRGQALHHIAQVEVWFALIELGRVHKAHDRHGALAGAQAPD